MKKNNKNIEYPELTEYYNSVYNALVLISREKVTEWYVKILWFKSETKARTVNPEILTLISNLCNKINFSNTNYLHFPSYIFNANTKNTSMSSVVTKLDVLLDALRRISHARAHYMNISFLESEMVVYAEDTVDIAKKALNDIKYMV